MPGPSRLFLEVKSTPCSRQALVCHSVQPSEGRHFIPHLASHLSHIYSSAVDVEGDFEAQSSVKVCDTQGREVARGLTNFSSREIGLLKGRPSAEAEELLGYVGPAEVIHRDNLVSAKRGVAGSAILEQKEFINASLYCLPSLFDVQCLGGDDRSPSARWQPQRRSRGCRAMQRQQWQQHARAVQVKRACAGI